jgi:hypothetical protein
MHARTKEVGIEVVLCGKQPFVELSIVSTLVEGGAVFALVEAGAGSCGTDPRVPSRPRCSLASSEAHIV